MTDSKWAELLSLFEDNARRLGKLEPAKPERSAKFWRESAHGTLGHLTACQAAWLPLMEMMKDGAVRGSIAIRPDPLYTKLGFATEDWDVLLKRFKNERSEWRRILRGIDLKHELKTRTRILTAQTLTKRMVEHERRHLDDLEKTLRKGSPKT